MAENYIVSARKYRPQTFDTVVGQEHITTTLKNAIRNNHLAHAYLFCGPRGVGKTTCARILARTINCQNPTPDMEACGVCPTCQAFKDHTSFNIFELDAASNNSVDDIRSLTDQVRFAPQTGKYKVYIIDEVHMLSASAFNAFLKTLEEPPPYAIFILATTEKHKILPTILSRCQIFDFKRITTHDITNHLQGIASKESMVAEEAALHVIAQKSEGCMRDALSMLDRIASFTNGMLTYGGTMQHLNLLDADYYFKLVDCMLAQDVSNTLLLLDEVLEKGFEGDVVIEGLAEHMRNLLLCKDPRMAKLLDVPKDHQAVYYEKANQTPPSFIVSALNILNDCELNYKNANNKRLHVEMCLIRLCYVMQATQGADVKKNSSEVSTPQASYQPPAPAQNIAPTPPQAKPQAQPTPAPQPQKEVPQPSVPPIAKSEPPVNAQPATDNQPAPAPPPMPPRPTSNGNGARRISKNMMDEIEQALNTTIAQAAEEKELTQELVEEVFAKWIKKLKDESREVYHAQFISMTVEAAPPDEVRIVSPTHLAEEYAKAQRDVLIDFFRVETGIQMLRVMTEVREDAAAAAAEQPTVLSRTEMYEEMAKKNPLLDALKNGLGMQIEY